MLIDRAERDIYNAKLLVSPEGNPSNDEMIDDIAAYHVQQGIEKVLKYAMYNIGGLDESARSYRTHSIPALIDLVEESCNIKLPERLVLAANDITGWEANSRYGNAPVTVRNDILEAIDIYEEVKQQILEAEQNNNNDGDKQS